ncbi:MAG: bcr [Gammaproteobacteria bacterium]|jgi:MFS family permease|nr:bcr [Gammaproteobacteria bacterium]
MNSAKPSMLSLFLLVTFSAVNAVLFTPALPSIADYFAISPSLAQLTISLYLIGYAVGQLLYGPLAKSYGYKKAIYAGIILCFIGIVFCLIAEPLQQFIYLAIGRLLMALGASVGLTMSFTIVSSCYEQVEAKKKLSILMTGFAIAPGISISIGGFLVERFNWQSCFYFLAAYAVLVTYLSSRLPSIPESLDHKALQVKNIVGSYIAQIKKPSLLLGALVMGLCTAYMYTFSAEAPFISINLMHMQPGIFGLWSLLPSLGILIGSQLSAVLSKRLATLKSMSLGLGVNAAGSVIMLLALIADPKPGSLFISMGILLIGNCLMYIQASILVLNEAQDKANASAMMSFLNMGLATLCVFSLGLFPKTLNLLPILYIGLAGLIGLLIMAAAAYGKTK